MPITALSTDWGVYPRLIRITTTDSFETLTTDGYWTAQQPYILELNNGLFDIFNLELVGIIWDGGSGFVQFNSTNQTFQALPNSGNISNSLPAGEIIVGNASNVAAASAMTGAISITDAGVTSINAGAVSAADIADNVIGSGQLMADVLQYASVSMTSADFLDMYADPFEIIETPGSGNLIVIDQVNLLMAYDSTAYAAGGAVVFQYGDTAEAGGQAASATIAAAHLQGTASDAEMVLGVLSNAAYTNCVDMGIYITNASAAFTTGNSPFTVNIWYRVVAA